MKFNNNSYEELETTINILYSDSCLEIYTSKKSVYERLEKKLNKPNDTYYIKDKICGGRWKIPFSDKRKITSVLSRPLLIGSMK